MKLLDWFRLHPWIATSFFVGVGCGVILCLPLVPFDLPESSASLIGSATGAFIAVWGAAWVAEGKARRSAAIARTAIRKGLQPVINVLSEFLADMDSADESGNLADVELARDRLIAMRANFNGFVNWLNTTEPLFRELGAVGMSAFADIHQTSQLLFDLLGNEIDHMFVLNSRGQIRQFRNILRGSMAELDKPA